MLPDTVTQSEKRSRSIRNTNTEALRLKKILITLFVIDSACEALLSAGVFSKWINCRGKRTRMDMLHLNQGGKRSIYIFSDIYPKKIERVDGKRQSMHSDGSEGISFKVQERAMTYVLQPLSSI